MGEITFLLGSDLAGDKGMRCSPNPIIMKVPRIDADKVLAKLHPGVSSCVVACAKKRVEKTCTEHVRDHSLVDLFETFFCGTASMSPWTISPVVENAC